MPKPLKVAPQLDPLSVKGLPFSHFNTLIEKWGGRDALVGKSTAQVSEMYLKPMTIGTQGSLIATYYASEIESLRALPQNATWFVSHAWGCPFLDTLDALTDFFGDRGLEDPIVWFDLFSNPQHGTASKPFEWWQTVFLEAVKTIGSVVMILQPWEDPVPLRRCWCVYELYACKTTNSQFDFAVTFEQKEEFLRWLLTHVETFFMKFHDVSSRFSKSTNPKDRKAIFKVIKKNIGFLQLDLLVLDTVRDWVRRILTQKIKEAKVNDKGELTEEVQKWINALMKFNKTEKVFDEAVRRAKKLFGKRTSCVLQCGSMMMGPESDEDKAERLARRLRKNRWRKAKARFLTCGRMRD
ncbi:hypothetical protein BC830DRAFT_1080528 [Chytriomyces sp. MP71]|nr:hypothetical protein BC830DRAFT_1080528 [Chytriomyces sp. MP71]